MKTSLNVLLSGLLLTQLIACQSPSVTSSRPAAVSSPGATSSPAAVAKAKTLNSYYLPLNERFSVASAFTTQAIANDQQTLVNAAVNTFVADMTGNKTADYFKEPDFSIKLLAGSEGSYFQSAEALTQLTNASATLALALVVYPDNSSDTFKGQLINQTFYFDGSSSLPENNTTYLVSLDSNQKPQVLTGSLKPFSVSSASESPTPTPVPSATAVPTPSPTPIDVGLSQAKEDELRKTIQALQQQIDEYRRQVNNFQPGPPPPPRPGQSGQTPPPPYLTPELRAKLLKERPELVTQIEALKDLPPQQHYDALKKIQEANPGLLPPMGPRPNADGSLPAGSLPPGNRPQGSAPPGGLLPPGGSPPPGAPGGQPGASGPPAGAPPPGPGMPPPGNLPPRGSIPPGGSMP